MHSCSVPKGHKSRNNGLKLNQGKITLVIMKTFLSLMLVNISVTDYLERLSNLYHWKLRQIFFWNGLDKDVPARVSNGLDKDVGSPPFQPCFFSMILKSYNINTEIHKLTNLTRLIHCWEQEGSTCTVELCQKDIKSSFYTFT